MYRRRPTDSGTITFVQGYDIMILKLYIFISQSNKPKMAFTKVNKTGVRLGVGKYSFSIIGLWLSVNGMS